MVGSYEPALAFGVALSAATVKAEALRMGLIQEGQELNAAARAQAAYSLILQGTTAAHGDAAKTADGTANSFKFLKRDITELTTTIGTVLIPLITPVIRGFGDMLNEANALDPAVEGVTARVESMAAAMTALVDRAKPVLMAFFQDVRLELDAVGRELRPLEGLWYRVRDVLRHPIRSLTGPRVQALGSTGLDFNAHTAQMQAAAKIMADARTSIATVPPVVAAATTSIATSSGKITRGVKESTKAIKTWFDEMRELLLTPLNPQQRLDRAGAAGGEGAVPAMVLQPIAQFAAAVEPAGAAVIRMNYAMDIAGQGVRNASLWAIEGLNSFAFGAVRMGEHILDSGLGMADAVRGGLLFAGAMEAINAALAPIAPLFDMLLTPLRVIGDIAGRLLAPVFKAVGIAASYVGEIFYRISAGMAKAVGGLIYGLGKAIDKIPGLGDFGLKDAGNSIRAWGDGMKGSADDLRDARNALKNPAEEAAEALNKLTASVTNAVQGFNILLHRNRALAGGGGGSVPTIPQSRPPHVERDCGPVTITSRMARSA